MEVLLDFCGSCFEYLILNPEFLLVHIVGFVILNCINDVVVTLRVALLPLLFCELLLAASWYWDCFGMLGTLPVSAVCLVVFVYGTRLGKITIKEGATFTAGNYTLLIFQ